jgi:hypothetical protein
LNEDAGANALVRFTAIVEVVRKRQAFLLVACHAKRLECAELAPAFGRAAPFENASKLDALQTLRAFRELLCHDAFCGATGLSPIGSLA